MEALVLAKLEDLFAKLDKIGDQLERIADAAEAAMASETEPEPEVPELDLSRLDAPMAPMVEE